LLTSFERPDTQSRAVAIGVEGLGKRYRIGPQSRGNELFAERVTRAQRRVFDRLRGRRTEPRTGDNWLWALRGVGFDVYFGETLGIVGRNGAGKSTLLRMLAQVTTPTEGRIVTYGRVTGLLGVGTGFHPQLTGRENVFLNASLMGMSRRQTLARFDEIVEFSGVARFLDTPVKHYSTGMHTRLAFSVAAHLDPEILLVDEVLSVGDAEFKSKCMDKMRSVTSEGRTVIFVSHSLGQVEDLCDRVILLERGNLEAMGNPDAVITEYVNRLDEVHEEPGADDRWVPAAAHAGGDRRARLVRVRLTDADDEVLETVPAGRPFRVHATFEVASDVPDAIFELGLATPGGQRFTATHSTDGGAAPETLRRGFHEVSADLHVHLQPGEYRLEVAALSATDQRPFDLVPDALTFTVFTDVDRDTWLAEHERGAYLKAPSEWGRAVEIDAPEDRWR
jgi:lipopolysaccharide transport system ATP-binding protein